MKLSKKAVGFEVPAKGMMHCSLCRHWQGRTCEIVDGDDIDADDWCRRFLPKSILEYEGYRRKA